MRNQAEFYAKNPPSCLDGFKVQYTEIDSSELDGHGEDLNPAFKLRCQCGDSKFLIFGHYWKNPETGETFFVSPLSAECTGCSNKIPVFDIQKDGYDSVLGHGVYSAYGEGNPVPYSCAACLESSGFEVVARFEYPSDLFDEGFEEARGKERELFTWFSLLGHCSACDAEVTISEDECA